MKYLIIAAHPDDEVLGCGGSMAKGSKDGHDVHVLIMSEGATSRTRKALSGISTHPRTSFRHREPSQNVPKKHPDLASS